MRLSYNNYLYLVYRSALIEIAEYLEIVNYMNIDLSFTEKAEMRKNKYVMKRVCLPRIFLLKLFLILSSLSMILHLHSQDIAIDERKFIDSLIYEDLLSDAENIINNLKIDFSENDIDRLWIISRIIKIKEKEKNFDESVKLMKIFVKDEFAIKSYDINTSVTTYQQDSFPYALIQWLMPEYYRKIVNHLVQNGKYEEGLKYLQIQQKNYPFNLPCKVGLIDEKDMEFIILSSRIHINLKNYDTVTNLLLPLNFGDSYGVFTGKENERMELDSILYRSLRERYTDKEIIDELDRSVENAIDKQMTFGLLQPFCLYMFGREIKGLVNINRVIRREAEIRSNPQDLDSDIIRRQLSVVRRQFISKTVKSMRIYEHIMSK